MRILITNDDGIYAPGLALMERIAKTFSDDILVVAPEYDQSGVAHSLTLNDPLRLRKISERHFAVKGTPTDCVILGVCRLLEGARPDLVLSGVNNGQNVAEDVTYPACPPEAVKGIAVSVQGRRDAQTAMIDERADGRGNPYYWISFTRGNSTPEHGTDLAALAQNNISVTPLKLDLTDEPALTRLALVLR